MRDVAIRLVKGVVALVGWLAIVFATGLFCAAAVRVFTYGWRLVR